MFDRCTGLALLLLMGPAPLSAQEDARAGPLDLEATQAKADAAFEAGRYAEAYEIYLDDLVPTGDKYAQYMVGVMHLHGLGRPRDVPLGAAWIALAAERGDAKLEAERDAVAAKLGDDERKTRQSMLLELQARFGDCALVAQALAESREQVDASTGSRLASGVSQPVTVLFDQAEEDGRLSQRDLRKLMRKRERFLRDSCPPQGA
ncbi:MAG: hypothetical protein ACREVN_02345 [Gammaproteobacteria bacterium]